MKSVMNFKISFFIISNNFIFPKDKFTVTKKDQIIVQNRENVFLTMTKSFPHPLRLVRCDAFSLLNFLFEK